ncbi:M48 family metallopeptidase [Aquiflexum gelatinilyticum]|uniref:M48 family metallopeptidase n=1 Tax=Aquiflexum gelatinilyticum TaxID=2961943 RepID=UPI00216A494D|nr:M48 family metallopeptidase [Aquiflexum gelatinilyticum]MCS4432923.1 M48 family metallopeptidase [Aquiflexum gelatinilyticum]
MFKKIAFFIAMGIFVYSCAQVPMSGRSQLALVDNAELLPMAFVEYDKVLKEGKVITNTADGQMVVKVGKRIASAVEKYMKANGFENELQGFQWEFNLIQEAIVNAWCMPGGKVAFYTGIIPVCQDEAGIAVVMGHEVAHAIANHGRERMSNGMLMNGLLGTAQAAMGQNPTLTQNLMLQAFGVGGELGMLSFSRKHELEADQLGLNFMALAGYDPRVAPAFWERMEKAGSGEAPPEFLSTHPGPKKRIDELNKQMSVALEYYEQSKK